MPTTEEARHRLHGRLDLVLGTEDATTLMEHLPPGGWDNMATKHDVREAADRLRVESRHQGDRMNTRLDAVDAQFAGLESTVANRDVMNARFDAVDARFEVIESTMAKRDVMDARFDAVNERFDAVNERFDAMDARFAGLESSVTTRDVVYPRFDAVDARFEVNESNLAAEIKGVEERLTAKIVTMGQSLEIKFIRSQRNMLLALICANGGFAALYFEISRYM